MGDVVNQHRFDQFKAEFERDYLDHYRSPLLDALNASGEISVTYYLEADPCSWEVGVYCAISRPGAETSETMRLENGATFCLADVTDEDLLNILCDDLDLDEDEATSRLVSAGLLDVAPEDKGTPNDPAWYQDEPSAAAAEPAGEKALSELFPPQPFKGSPVPEG